MNFLNDYVAATLVVKAIGLAEKSWEGVMSAQGIKVPEVRQVLKILKRESNEVRLVGLLFKGGHSECHATLLRAEAQGKIFVLNSAKQTQKFCRVEETSGGKKSVFYLGFEILEKSMPEVWLICSCKSPDELVYKIFGGVWNSVLNRSKLVLPGLNLTRQAEAVIGSSATDLVRLGVGGSDISSLFWCIPGLEPLREKPLPRPKVK